MAVHYTKQILTNLYNLIADRTSFRYSKIKKVYTKTLLLFVYRFTKGEFCDLLAQKLTTSTSWPFISMLFVWALQHQIFNKMIPAFIK